MDARQWCRERLLRPGHPLAASLLFMEPDPRDRILALRALINELAALDDPALDPTVRAAKFAWWRQALIEGAPHPALHAMAQVGGTDRVAPISLLPLLESTGELPDNPRFERYEELWAHCQTIGGEAARLESRLGGAEESLEASAIAMGAAGYLVRIVRDLTLDARNNRWFVPLDLQAQFQVARSDVLASRGGPGWDGLVRTLVERALREGNNAADNLAIAHRHLRIQWSLDCRLAAKLARRPGLILQRRIVPGHAGNVWTAWRAARRLNQR